MKAKEKAKELVYSMFNVDLECKNESMCMLYPHAKQCALICVDEIIKQVEKYDTLKLNDYVYWLEVRQEIEKL